MVAVFGPGKFYGAIQAEHRLDNLSIAHLAGTIPEHEVAEHGHDDAHFVLATHGCYLTTAYGEATEGPLLVFNPPGVVHRDCFAGAGGWFLAASFPSQAWRALADRPVTDALRLSRPRAVGAALRLTWAAIARSPDALHLEALALELASEAESPTQEAAHRPSWLDAAEHFIADRLDAPITVADIARAVDVHPVHLARGFRRWLACSPGERLRQRRLARAAHLMSLREADLGEVALLSGFCDQSHMTRVFSAAWGMAPGKYRRLLGAGRVAYVQDGRRRHG
jgi:AraC family transcriptional regulator